MPTYDKIKTELLYDGQVLRVILNVPKGNVLDNPMMTDVMSAVREEGRAAAVKAVVFQGAGDHFSFGASVPEHTKELVGDMLKTFHNLMRILLELSKPMFALVRGQCLGGGLELAAFCNWIFASEEALFGQPEIKLAVFPPVASLILPHRIGQSAADDLVLSGRSITASEAKDLGLVHSIAPDPEKALNQFIVEHILPKSTVALQFAVKSSRYEMYQHFLRNIEAVEKMYVQELMSTKDANEGIQAFMEKRKPEWQNK